jgi:hypothetical protein
LYTVLYSKQWGCYYAITLLRRYGTEYLTKLAIKGSSRKDNNFSLKKYF